MKENSQWISFDKELPPKDKPVIAYSPKRGGYYSVGKTMHGIDATDEDIKYYGVTHWKVVDKPDGTD